MKTFKLEYIDWKGKKREAYLFADNEKEAHDNAMQMQGVAWVGPIYEVRD